MSLLWGKTPPAASSPFGVDKCLSTKSLSSLCSARKLDLNGSVPQPVAASRLSEQVTVISPLKRREARQLGLLAGQDKYSRIGGDDPLICDRSSADCAQWFNRSRRSVRCLGSGRGRGFVAEAGGLVAEAEGWSSAETGDQELVEAAGMAEAGLVVEPKPNRSPL